MASWHNAVKQSSQHVGPSHCGLITSRRPLVGYFDRKDSSTFKRWNKLLLKTRMPFLMMMCHVRLLAIDRLILFVFIRFVATLQGRCPIADHACRVRCACHRCLPPLKKIHCGLVWGKCPSMLPFVPNTHLQIPGARPFNSVCFEKSVAAWDLYTQL